MNHDTNTVCVYEYDIIFSSTIKGNKPIQCLPKTDIRKGRKDANLNHTALMLVRTVHFKIKVVGEFVTRATNMYIYIYTLKLNHMLNIVESNTDCKYYSLFGTELCLSRFQLFYYNTSN